MHVGIVGAGISGLYTGLLLHREGHQVTIFEASNRVGGRIYTHRFTSQAEDHDAYFEAGAMRVPRSTLHTKVFDLVRYLNTHSKLEAKIELIPYVLEHENNKTFIQNKKGALSDSTWPQRLGLPEKYWGISARELLNFVISPWLELLRRDFEAGFQALLEYDEFSFRAFLRLEAQWAHEVVDFVELFCSQTNQFDLSFTEIIMQNLDFDTKEWATIKDGMSRMPEAAASLVGWYNIHLNARIDRIKHVQNDRIQLSLTHSDSPSFEFDKVVLALPPAAVQSITDRPKWSFRKEQALRGAHYEPLYKIGLRFKTRFWERSVTNPCFGGQSTTDLRFRWIVFPSNDLGSSGSGVLLLYCWMTDASKWLGVPREQRIRICLHDLSLYFAEDPKVNVGDEFIEAFDVAWTATEATGDAMFLPGQFSRYHDIARKPEGNIYFAGEHLSKHHTWIAGALDSALKTTAEMLDRPLLDSGDSQDKISIDRKPLKALGQEFATPALKKHDLKTGIDRKSLQAFVIPAHMNVQYIETY